MTGRALYRSSGPSGMRLPADRVVLILYLATLLFDFRRSDDDRSMFVVVMGVANLGLGTLLLLMNRQIGRGALLWVLPIGVFVVAGVFTGLLRDQALYATISRTVPVVIFGLAAVNVASLTNRLDTDRLISLVAVFALIAVVWKIAFGFAYYGLSISNVRYQIIAGSLPLVYAYGLTGFLVKRRKLVLASLFAALLTVGLSVTRSYLVVFAIATVAGVTSMPRNRLLATLTRSGMVLLGLAAAAGLAALFAPDVAARWAQRLGAGANIGFDLTGATRIAEITYQLQRLDADTTGLLFGFGHAAETRFAGVAADLVQSVLGASGVDYTGHGYGHNLFVGIVYIGGLLFGLPVIAVLGLALMKARRVVTRRWNVMTEADRFALIWGLSAFAGYLGYGLLGSAWGDRSASFFFGLAFGLVLRAITTPEPGVALRPPRGSPSRPETFAARRR